MAKEYIRKCSKSIVIRETQIKTTLRFHLTPIKMAKIKIIGDNTCWRVYSRVTEHMGSFNIVREFVNDLQPVVQLPNNDQQQLWMEVQASSSCSVLQGKQSRKGKSSNVLI